MTLYQALVFEHGNLDLDAKGEAGGVDPQVREYRCEVRGAESLVVALSIRNGMGAKGWPRPAGVIVSTVTGRNQ